jgi:hypothetical protein
MERRILLLTLRAAVAIGATAFVIGFARSYLADSWHFSIPSPIYALAGYSLLLVVLWLSTRTLITQLAAKTNLKHGGRRSDQPTVNDSLETIHRYPLTLTLSVATLGVVAALLPYLAQTSRTSTYAICFGAACCLLVIAIHLLTYRVAVRSDRISIRTASATREIALSEIREVKVVKTRNGSQIVIALKNNKVVRFGRMLTGFSAMLDALGARSGAAGFILHDGSAS